MSIEDDFARLGMVVEGDMVEIEAALDEFCPQVVEYAQGLAAVFGESGRDDHRTAPADGEPGDFRESIHVAPTRKLGERQVGSDSMIALWQEMGTRHFPEDAIFAKTDRYFGGNGRILMDEGVQSAQGTLRSELEKLAKMTATGAAAHHVVAQRAAVEGARQARSSAFKAARSRSTGGGRRGRRR